MKESDAVCPLDDEDTLLIEDDREAEAHPSAAANPWKVLVVDDDADVHHATELALRGLLVEGRPLLLLHAFSGAQARELVAATEDLAVILLDVVMEAEDAGLRLVVHVREVLKRSALRIILRTGQPGYAPEMDTIRNYDINDYKTKSELTRVRLFTSLTSAVRAYQQMRAHEEMRRGLEAVVQASTSLTKLHGMQLFAQGVVAQLCALLNVEPEGLICAQAGIEKSGEPARVIAASGQFSHMMQQPLSELALPEVSQALQQCLNERRGRYEPPLLLYFATEDERGIAAYVDVRRELEPLDRHLLEVFCASTAVGFENVLLYGRLVDQAYVDPLLRIPNLNRLIELLAATSSALCPTTLALLDVDEFSAINDTLGHEFGDAVLRAIADRLSAALPQATLARIGSDVFALLGPSAELGGDTLQRLFADVFNVKGQRLRISASCGLVQLAETARTGTALLRDAHVALKQAKLHQRGKAIHFSESMGQDARERMHLLNGLRNAFDAQHLFLVYQPKLHLATGQASGVEALLRWRRADGHFVPPDRFIPLAEKAGLMVALGSYVLRAACSQLARLRAAGYMQLSMAINVSHAQLREPGFTEVLRQVLSETAVPPAQIELEITESMAADDLELVSDLLVEIAALGVTVAIDDFGTGFSSLGVLRKLQAHRLKIDRGFVNEMHKDDSIARMVIGLGHSMGMSITAEGVETEQQAQALKALGCEEVQGWLYSRPLDEPALLTWLDQHGSARASS